MPHCHRGVPPGSWPKWEDAVAFQMFHGGIFRVSDEGFRLKLHDQHPEAPLSPIYIDLRRLRGNPMLMYDVAETLCVRQHLNYPDPPRRPTDVVLPHLLCDIPHSISPVVALMAFISQRPMITVREQAKGHGLGGLIVGSFEPGQEVLLVDDVCTKAGSKIAATKALRDAGLVVKRCVVVIDRQQGGAAQLAEAGVDLCSLYTMDSLLATYVEEDLILPSVVERFNAFVEATKDLI